MTALLLVATGLFVGALQALFMAVLGQEIAADNRSKARTALAVGGTAYLLQAGLFVAAGLQLAAHL